MKHGITRSVILIGSYAFKFPSVRNGMQMFLEGMLANWKERAFYKQNKTYYKGRIAESYFCFWFGLLSIQEKLEVSHSELTGDEIEFFNGICTETKPVNFGYDWFGRFKCLDYPS